MTRSNHPKVPPLAGVCSYAEAQRTGLGVERDVELLRRYHFIKRKLIDIQTAHLNAVPEWEIKGALSLHTWLDAEHVTWLSKRVAEMREPPLRLDEEPDPEIAALMAEALRAHDTVELLTGIYRVLRPALIAAYESHMQTTNPLVDHATCRYLRFMRLEEKDMIDWGDQALTALLIENQEAQRRARNWEQHLRAFLAAAGGVQGDQKRPDKSLPEPRATKPFEPDLTPKRDQRFSGLFNIKTPADLVYLDNTRSFEERNLALLYKRLREMDVPEVIAGIMAQTKGRPWQYYRDMARQLWDESRHAMMGEVALASRGVDWTKLPINITFSYKLNRLLAPEERHILLYDIEQSLMPGKSGKRMEWEIALHAGDRLSTTFHDFDWADEVLHVAIGKACLLKHLAGGKTEALNRARQIWQKLEDKLRADPFPETDERNWWVEFAAGVLNREIAPVEQPPSMWRPGISEVSAGPENGGR